MVSGVPGRAVMERSLSFKNWEPGVTELDRSFSEQATDDVAPQPSCLKVPANFVLPHVKLPEQLAAFSSPRPLRELDAAATTLQKVYKGYRTRRNLADCAVVVEELWWKALDFASLKRSSVSFFRVEKPETAVSKWTRAKKRLAKIDPRHRYGHNLHLYYDVWFASESTQPFFYWLDVGDGREVNIAECPRSTLQKQFITYLGPKEREAYEVTVRNGKLVYKQSERLLNTTQGSKWIFVLSTSRSLYVGKKKKGTFQHSSFLAGGATTAAGRIVAEEGVLEAVWPYSGHYLPTEYHFGEFISFLRDNHVDLTNVQRRSFDDDKIPACSNDNGEAEAEAAAVDEIAESETKVDSKEDARDESMEKEVDLALGRRLSCKWTTGAGARIGCVRDYPADLQFKALEQVNLSPRLVPSPIGNKTPIPSPRPSREHKLSPRLQFMGHPTPVFSPTLPKPNK
ncbi:calmodulin-binding protein [Musa troglodytarum]|uniref:Calmodulin-binding protein n=1 Tax=Musa troglodytarum TaxID=320322 RepID=A0A9E7L550_9LILI|nr:calmodulin-binding protein [Musa troglodytarum]